MAGTQHVEDAGTTLDRVRRETLWAALGRRAADIAREVSDRGGSAVVAGAAQDPDHPLCWALEDRDLALIVPAPALACLEVKWGLAGLDQSAGGCDGS